MRDDVPAPVPGASETQRWSRRSVVIGVVIALLFGLWWWWPSLTRDFDRVDVVVVGTGEVRQADEPIQRRIREEGMSVEMVDVDPCSDADAVIAAVEEYAPTVVVVSPSRTACDDWGALVEAVRDATGNTTVIALAQSGSPELVDGARAAGAVVADPSRLLGGADSARVGCLWWDDCEPDGQVTVRDADGRLTDAGEQRVARVLVGVIP